ncbi:MAG: TlpA family protein disulfide reductase [Blastocatellia bacterium]|nr:TlpA family protein disulfide reductase [Blastocatellia bacterium]
MKVLRVAFTLVLGGLFLYLILTPTEKQILDNIEGGAPDFSMTAFDRKRLQLSDYRGKVVMINFWATWCGPCQQEIPSLIAIQEKYKQEGVEVLGISVDSADRVADVEAFISRYEINYRVALDNGQVFTTYQGSAIPLTIFVDRQGRMRARYEGLITKQEAERELVKLLVNK